jgi:hypothetical protein
MNLDQDGSAQVDNGNDGGSAGLDVRGVEATHLGGGGEVGTELDDQVGDDLEVSNDGDSDIGVDFSVNGCVDLGG